MPTNFLSLPSELRNNIYEQLLVLQEPIKFPLRLWQKQSKLQALTLELLRVNKTVHLEASSMFYSQNRFDFTMCTSNTMALFLEQVGRNNAGYILYLYIDFPTLEYPDLTIEDDSDCILAKIQSSCTNLRTLGTYLYSAITLKLNGIENHKIAAEALALVDARFRAISSLQEITVEVYGVGPSDYIRTEMKNHGWTIITEYIEDSGSDRSFSYFEDDDYRYDDGDDDYDIENDSDFWRRAMD